MIRFQCQCGKRLKVDDTHAGRAVRCSACGKELIAPAASPAVAKPGQGKRPPALPGSKLPLYIGLGVAGGVTAVVVIVCAVMFRGGDSRQQVRPPVVVKIPPSTQTADTSDEPSWGFFRKVKPQK